MRIIGFLICCVVLFGCGSSSQNKTEEEAAVQEEVVTDAEQPEEPQPYKEPDGAFGAKDFATEAKDMSDRNTREVEQAAEADPNENDQ